MFKGCPAGRRMPLNADPSGGASRPRNQPCEVSMEGALSAVQLLFYLLGGLGLFFTGIGALWFVSVYKGKSE